MQECVMKFECVELKPVNQEFLKGFAKVKILDVGITIHNISLFKKEDKCWISMPSKEYLKDGKKSYFQFIQFENKEDLEEIKKCILEKEKSSGEIPENFDLF